MSIQPTATPITIRSPHRAPASDQRRAYLIASDYGSFLHAGDPGACFYGFRFNDGRPDSEQHRAKCIAYTRKCLSEVRGKHVGVMRTQAHAVEMLDLRWLLAWFHRCELFSGSRVDMAK